MNKTIIENIKKEAQSHIANARLKEALLCIQKFVERYSVSHNELEKHFLTIFYEYSNIRARGIDGVLSTEEVRLFEARLTSRFLTFLEDFDTIELSDIEDKSKIEHSNEIVPHEFYTTKDLILMVDKIIKIDDKIYDLKVIIENKRIEITKTNKKEVVEKLEHEIIQLRYELTREKSEYHNLKAEYDELKKEIGIKNSNINDEDFKLANNIKSAFVDILEDYKGFVVTGVSLIKEEMLEAFRKDKAQTQANNGMFFQYLDDMNKRISNLEKLLNQNK